MTPTTMRPPFGDIGKLRLTELADVLKMTDGMQRHADDRVRAISLAMGMVPIIWTTTPASGPFDTNGKWAVASLYVTEDV